ncbi:MAG: hypothetical protein R3F08_05045 [Dokdonella sp.]
MGIDLALIGGTGLYRLAGLEDVVEHNIETRWGMPSDPVVVGRLGSSRVAFLARHGRQRYRATQK